MATPAFEPGSAYADALDAADDLAHFRRSFHLPKDGARTLVYLCGHSLGLMPRRARRCVEIELDRWSVRGVEGHFAGSDGWFAYHERFAEPLAELTGAGRDEVVAMNSLTVNLHLLLVSFFRPAGRRNKILIERGAFPSDRYAVQSQLRFHGFDPKRNLIEIDASPEPLTPERFSTLLAKRGDEIALVLLPGVQFLTGQALAIEEYARIARAAGCVIGFDLAHAIGNVPIALHDAGADFAVWCSYKYLNAGPGAVGGCFIHRRWIEAADLPRLTGWWGHDKAARFLLQQEFQPIASAEAWQLSNPPILAMAPLAASLPIFQAATMRALRAKSLRLTGYLEALVDHELGNRVELLTPRDPRARGCQLSLRVNVGAKDGAAVQRRLRATGVVADWRGDVLRLAPVPLYNRFRDAFAAVRALERALSE
jgi:kynureninase